jgi:hypothetical protein
MSHVFIESMVIVMAFVAANQGSHTKASQCGAKTVLAHPVSGCAAE